MKIKSYFFKKVSKINNKSLSRQTKQRDKGKRYKLPVSQVKERISVKPTESLKDKVKL